MHSRPYGRTGLSVPVLGFGAMQVGAHELDERHVERLLHHVLDAGLTLIDTARSYGLAEARIGRLLAGRREEFVLSTKVGYGVPGLRDWTYDCIVAGVDAARDRLRTDVIDIVHLHSCPLETLQSEDVVRALVRCRELGKIRVAAYSGDSTALAHAVSLSTSPTSPTTVGEVARSAGEGSPTSPTTVGEVARSAGEGSSIFGGVQASVSLCDQQNLPVLALARSRGIGTLAKRSLAGRPWAGGPTGDPVHDEYRRRFDFVRAAVEVEDWDEFALRFTAYAPGVDCVIVGGTDAANVDRNVATIARGPLKLDGQSRVAAVYATHGRDWQGLV
jgi:aryl-alcohol dehydrogenase-like predicted oxidoreductase